MKTKALARLREQAAPGRALNYVHTIARQVFGDVKFDPEDTVSIAGGIPHLHVVPQRPPTMQQLTYFSKLMNTPGVNAVRVQGVSPDKDHGPNSLKVEFYTRLS